MGRRRLAAAAGASLLPGSSARLGALPAAGHLGSPRSGWGRRDCGVQSAAAPLQGAETREIQDRTVGLVILFSNWAGIYLSRFYIFTIY